ncbi:MAG: TolC family protein [Rhodocyclales bacterium]|nr:TolC family protein [Rhodocyclales bacterium]
MATGILGYSGRALICAVALLVQSALAVAAGPLAGGLASALEQAWRLHPQAAALDARDAEAQAAREIAGGLTPEPGAVSIGSRNDRANRNLGQQEYEVELATPLWLPGQKAAREDAAASQADEVAAKRMALRWELAGELREAWWALAAARNSQALAERRVETARALEADVRRRYRAGDLSRIDGNLARSEVLAADAELIEAEANRLQAEQLLRRLTGAGAPRDIGEEAPAQAAERTPEAAATHPLLAAAAAASRSARARTAVAAESRRGAPELALRVVRERGDFAEPYNNSIGVRLKIPFSSDAVLRRDTAAAQAEASQADTEMLRARTRVELETERARRTLAAAGQQLAMAEERRVLAADNLRLAEKAFSLGESDLAALLRIRAAAFDAESFYDRQRVARAAAISRLNQALGALP